MCIVKGQGRTGDKSANVNNTRLRITIHNNWRILHPSEDLHNTLYIYCWQWAKYMHAWKESSINRGIQNHPMKKRVNINKHTLTPPTLLWYINFLLLRVNLEIYIYHTVPTTQGVVKWKHQVQQTRKIKRNQNKFEKSADTVTYTAVGTVYYAHSKNKN